MASSNARSLWIALLAVPIVVGTVVAFFLGFQPAQAWQQGEQTTGAPADVVMPEDLTNARRAVSEAQSQAGFLVSGAQQLSKGGEQLDGGVKDLTSGIDELVTGTQQLKDGMVQIQAGTGQLGSGATNLANAVENATNQVVGLNAVRGQLLEAIDHSLRDLKGVNTAESRQAQDALTSLRGQVELVNFDQATQPLEDLRNGSRELSNQLDVAGYGYHDGIYTATEGARKLHAGALALRDGVGKLGDGSGELKKGTDRVASMADLNKTKVDSVARSLPAPVVPTSTGESTNNQDAEQRTATAGSINPVIALLIASLTALGGVAVGWAGHVRGARPSMLIALGTLGLTGVGAALAWLLAGRTTGTGLLLISGVLALASLATALSTVVIARALAPRWGVTAAFTTIGVLGAVQTAVCAWVWKSATVSEIAPWWTAVANLTPLNWATTGVTAAGNGGDTAVLITSAVVLGSILIVAAIGVIATRRPVTVAVAD